MFYPPNLAFDIGARRYSCPTFGLDKHRHDDLALMVSYINTATAQLLLVKPIILYKSTCRSFTKYQDKAEHSQLNYRTESLHSRSLSHSQQYELPRRDPRGTRLVRSLSTSGHLAFCTVKQRTSTHQSTLDS